MSAGMGDIIAAHTGSYEWSADITELHAYCSCGWRASSSGEHIHAAHVADELAKAGYGKLEVSKLDLDGMRKAILDPRHRAAARNLPSSFRF